MARISKSARGAKLAALRHGRGLTQSGLAHRAQLSVQYISRLETGVLPITDSALVKLAAGLDMGLDEFVAEIGRTRRNGSSAK